MYCAIDMKSFYASVEAVERGLDPMTTNLVVADPDRGGGTICLAITPAMKTLGVKNRCRVFEIPKNISYIMAPPRMALYIDYSARVYEICQKFFSRDDIHVYSIDEAFMDMKPYLHLYGIPPKEIGKKVMGAIYSELGLRSTCGIGTNLYLAKVALDLLAKHAEDFVGELNEETYRQKLWTHEPLTDFWRIGPATARRLAKYGIFTMKGVANADENLLYKIFGIDAELLIDHAWGREPVRISDIKKYQPKSKSLSNGQVLLRDYTFYECRIIVQEMMDELCLELVKKGLVSDSATLYVSYTHTAELPPERGTVSFPYETSADTVMIPLIVDLYDRIITRKDIALRRVHIFCNHVRAEEEQQLSFLVDTLALDKAKRIQEATLAIKQRYGKNVMFRCVDLSQEATTLMRNNQIGGHKANG